MKKFIEIGEQIKKIKVGIQGGNELLKYQIPNDLTPEVLFGESNDKRTKKQTLILNIVNKSMADLR